MSPCAGGAPYKGLFLLVLVFVGLEYFFSTFSDNNNRTPFSFYNSTRLPQTKEPQFYGPLLQNLILKNKAANESNLANLTSTSDISGSAKNLSYIVTTPPFLLFTNSTNFTSTPDLATLEAENVSNVSSKIRTTDLPLCPEIPQNLHGRVPIYRSPVPSVNELERQFSWLKPGGHWSPPTCRPPKKVAIVVPFRCRGEHLLLFLRHMHPFLRRQQLDYTLFLVEQDGDGPFNRAMLMNIGYVEALKSREFDCFIFHDVDLLPEDDRNLYTCPEQPRHMSVAVDIFKYKLPYPAIFGGVSAITREHFKLLNGFSNSFWGWGGEDDDMSNRIRYHHLYISRYPLTIARYTMLTHKKDKPSPNRYDVLKQGQKRFDKDGLNSLKYELIQKKDNLLYTWILVKIEQPR